MPVPVVLILVEVESGQIIADGLVEVSMRALDLPVWGVDMALFGDSASHAEHDAGHPSASAAGAPRQPVQESLRGRQFTDVCQRLRVLNARFQRRHTALEQGICQQYNRLKSSFPSEPRQNPVYRRCGASRVATNRGREALAESVALGPVERSQCDRDVDRQFLPLFSSHRLAYN